MDRARFCVGCRSVRSSRPTRHLFTHRRANHISGSGAWCCRRNRPVRRLRHSRGIGWIENGRWQRRRRRYIARLCLRMFDQDAGTKHKTAHPLSKSCASAICSNLLAGIAVSLSPKGNGRKKKPRDCLTHAELLAGRHTGAEGLLGLPRLRQPPNSAPRR
jgi:hypothetical protein